MPYVFQAISQQLDDQSL